MMERNPNLGLPVQLFELISRWRGTSSGGPPFLKLPSIAYKKIGMLLDYIESQARTSDPASVMFAIETFGAGVGQWLKVAADCKAQLVESSMHRCRAWCSDVCVELGTFVGYTAIRLARWLEGPEAAPGKGVSFEVDAVHALLTRHNLSLTHLSSQSDVWIGQATDLVPRLTEDFGRRSLIFTFMDHRGTRFHSDLLRLQAHNLVLPRMTLVCDNTLKPGAPLCLWLAMHRPGSPSAASWSMNEFAHWNSEDWMLVSVLDRP